MVYVPVYPKNNGKYTIHGSYGIWLMFTVNVGKLYHKWRLWAACMDEFFLPRNLEEGQFLGIRFLAVSWLPQVRVAPTQPAEPVSTPRH